MIPGWGASTHTYRVAHEPSCGHASDALCGVGVLKPQAGRALGGLHGGQVRLRGGASCKRCSHPGTTSAMGSPQRLSVSMGIQKKTGSSCSYIMYCSWQFMVSLWFLLQIGRAGCLDSFVYAQKWTSSKPLD